MVSIAIIGLGTFGEKIIDYIGDADVEIIIIDKDRAIVEKYKDRVRDSYITDAIESNMLHKIIPEDIDAVVVDLGAQMETSILVTNELKKMGIKQIVVKACSDQHGEILKIVGATLVVFPDQDSAQRVTPLLISSVLFEYMQMSPLFGIAEVKVKKELSGMTLETAKFRQMYNLNAIAFRNDIHEDFNYIQNEDFVMEENMHLLVAGANESINAYVKEKEEIADRETGEKKEKKNIKSLFSKLFGKK